MVCGSPACEKVLDGALASKALTCADGGLRCVRRRLRPVEPPAHGCRPISGPKRCDVRSTPIVVCGCGLPEGSRSRPSNARSGHPIQVAPVGAEASWVGANTYGGGALRRGVSGVDASPVGHAHRGVECRAVSDVREGITKPTAPRDGTAGSRAADAPRLPARHARLAEAASSAVALLACAPIAVRRRWPTPGFGTANDLLTPGQESEPRTHTSSPAWSRSDGRDFGSARFGSVQCWGRDTRRQHASGSAVTRTTCPTIRRCLGSALRALRRPGSESAVLPGRSKTSNVCAARRPRRAGERSRRLCEHEPTRIGRQFVPHRNDRGVGTQTDRDLADGAAIKFSVRG